jgi:hypothetical protein
LEKYVSANTCWIPFDLLEAFIVDVFKGVGVPDEDARTCAEVLITADKRGIDSHGVGRLKPIYYDRIVMGRVRQPVTQFEVVRNHKATAVVDGHHGIGMVIARRCMKMAIEKARIHDLGTVVARNSTHFGYAASLPIASTPQAGPGTPDSVVTDWSVDPDDRGSFPCKVWDDWYRRGHFGNLDLFCISKLGFRLFFVRADAISKWLSRSPHRCTIIGKASLNRARIVPFQWPWLLEE